MAWLGKVRSGMDEGRNGNFGSRPPVTPVLMRPTHNQSGEQVNNEQLAELRIPHRVNRSNYEDAKHVKADD